jgi:FkbM family methyltransferase
MKNSHTLLIIEEAFQKTQEFNYKRYIEEISNLGNSSKKNRLRKHPVNQILETFGLHLMHKSLVSELEGNSYSKMGKWSSVGTLQFALKNPERFDEVYNMLEDVDSRDTFDWFMKFRAAYAFLGEIAKSIFPSSISSDEFANAMSKLMLDSKGFVRLGIYKFLSNLSEVAGSWVFEQYNLKDKCKVSPYDCVIDGGAFKGETAFWFLSKGAGKVHAFEPDNINFQVLSKNVMLNKVEGKIIPIKTSLSDKNGMSRMKMIGSGSSSSLGNGGTEVECIILDSFMVKNSLSSIDFIKLDVEGAETEVLRGATETIKRFRPKIAISVYHKPDDTVEIPTFLCNLLPEAKFYLRHFSDNISETILFVNPRC